MKTNIIKTFANDLFSIYSNDMKNIDSFSTALLMYSEYNVKCDWSYFSSDKHYKLFLSIIQLLDNSNLSTSLRSKIIRICKASKSINKYNDRINSMIDFYSFL